jgi:Fe-S-cluster-containing dehydrogenase component
MDRRDFFRLAGLGAVGVAGVKGLSEIGTAFAAGSMEVPKGAPGTKRWAMVIDVKKLIEQEDMDRLVDACHRVHNVPAITDASGKINRAEEVKWIWTETYHDAFPSQSHEYVEERLADQPVLVLCNHCDKPPCTRVCPTQATWKRESDGVVMMDWHRCIGCRYCIAACPYGSRSFNWQEPKPYLEEIDPEFPHRMRGVVEKCNFCEERLAVGKLPACVEACTHGALVFGDLYDERSEVRELLRTRHAIRRKPALGTQPEVFYLVDGFEEKSEAAPAPEPAEGEAS